MLNFINGRVFKYLSWVLVICLFAASVYRQGVDAGKLEIATIWQAERIKMQDEYDAQAEVARNEERVQYEISQKIQSDFSRDNRILANRLRDYNAETICTVSPKTEGAAGVNSTTAVAIGFAISDALIDTAQCSALIEWVKEQGF